MIRQVSGFVRADGGRSVTGPRPPSLHRKTLSGMNFKPRPALFLMLSVGGRGSRLSAERLCFTVPISARNPRAWKFPEAFLCFRDFLVTLLTVVPTSGSLAKAKNK